MRRRIEVPIEIDRIVEHAHVLALCRLPLDPGQQPGGIALEDGPIVVDVLEDGRRHWKDDPGGIEAPLRQDVMDQIAMQPAVPVREGVDVHEAEGQDGGRDHGVERLGGVAVEGDQAVDQARQVVRAGADVIGKGPARVPVVIADEAALVAKAQPDEALVADDDPLQTQQLLPVDGTSTGLADGAAPALDAVLRRPFALDGVAGAGVLQQKEGCGSGQDVLRNRRHDFARPISEVQVDPPLDLGRPIDEGTEGRGAGQVVPKPVARRAGPLGPDLQFRIQDGDDAARLGVRQVERLADQPLVEEPELAGSEARGLVVEEGFDGAGPDGLKQALQHREFEPLVLQGEGQVADKGGRGRVAGRQETPAVRLDDPVPVSGRREAAGQGDDET